MKNRIFAILVALALFCLPMSALAEQTNSASTLTVTGYSEVSLPADTAVICLGVRETAADVRDAQSAVNNKIAAVRNALVEMGIDNSDITTNSLYIYANCDYNYEGNEEKVVSYTANNGLKIVVKDIATTAAVIDTAFGAGANDLDYVNFLASNDSDAYDEAYRLAVADAKHKAEVLSEAAGVKLTAIVDISEGNNTNVYYERASSKNVMAAAESEDAGTDIQAAGVTVSANITIIYSISE